MGPTVLAAAAPVLVALLGVARAYVERQAGGQRDAARPPARSVVEPLALARDPEPVDHSEHLGLLLLRDDVARLLEDDLEPVVVLQLLRVMRQTLDELADETEAAALAHGMNNSAVARALGVSRDSVRQRQARLRRRAERGS
jgi:hypothetical protein